MAYWMVARAATSEEEARIGGGGATKLDGAVKPGVVLVRCVTWNEWGDGLGRESQGRSDEHVRAYSNSQVSCGGACSDGHGHRVTRKGEPLDDCNSGGVGMRRAIVVVRGESMAAAGDGILR